MASSTIPCCYPCAPDLTVKTGHISFHPQFRAHILPATLTFIPKESLSRFLADHGDFFPACSLASQPWTDTLEHRGRIASATEEDELYWRDSSNKKRQKQAISPMDEIQSLGRRFESWRWRQPGRCAGPQDRKNAREGKHQESRLCLFVPSFHGPFLFLSPLHPRSKDPL